MRINISNSLSQINNVNVKNELSKTAYNSKPDCFESTNANQTEKKNISFKGNFLSKIFRKRIQEQTPDMSPNPYIANLQKGVKEIFDENLPAANFNSIMTPDEFKTVLPNLNVANFDIHNKNSRNKNTIYCADLDSATTFSVGKTDIYTLLETVAQTADEYYEQTGKKFTFAITDRDTVEGVQHAVRIIASEPEKFKNMKFIPSMKMSFTHKVPDNDGHVRYENSEMLIYGINPFSEKLTTFVENTLEKRKDMTINFIQRVQELYPQFGYKVTEFATQNRMRFQKDFGVSNLYWRAREYVETKGDTEIRGLELSQEDIVKASIHILNELYRVQQGSENRNISALGSTLVKDDENINRTIKGVFEEHATHENDDGSDIIAPAENILDDMMDLFKNEETRPVMAIAAPYYLSHYYIDETQNTEETATPKDVTSEETIEQKLEVTESIQDEQEEKKDKTPTTFNEVVKFLKKLQEKSDGMLIAFESKAPKYRLDDKLFRRRTASEFPLEVFGPQHPMFFDLKEQEIVKKFNNFIRNSSELNLYEVGGSWHDPYKDKFII